MRNFELIEAEKSRFQIAEQTQKVLEKEAQTMQKQATIKAEAARDVAIIEVEAARDIAIIQVKLTTTSETIIVFECH